MKHRYREFLLGMSDEDAETRIEEGILDASIDPEHLRMAEDELIDDDLFGRLSQDEQRNFDSHFLCSSERRERYAFARSLMDFANSQAVGEEPFRPAPLKQAFWSLGWRTSAIAAMASALVVAILLGFQTARLRHEVNQAQNSMDEANRLQSVLAEKNQRLSHPTLPSSAHPSRGVSTETATDSLAEIGKPSPALDLVPGLTRGIQRELVLRLHGRPSVVWLDLELPAALSGKVREELIGADGEQLWMQEFMVTTALPMQKSTVALPASILVPGDYQMKLEQPTSSGVFEIVATYAFRVAQS